MKLTPITAFFLDMFIITGFRPMSNVFGLILNVITTKERVTGVITTLHVEKKGRITTYRPSAQMSTQHYIHNHSPYKRKIIMQVQNITLTNNVNNASNFIGGAK